MGVEKGLIPLSSNGAHSTGEKLAGGTTPESSLLWSVRKLMRLDKEPRSRHPCWQAGTDEGGRGFPGAVHTCPRAPGHAEADGDSYGRRPWQEDPR